MESLPSAFEDGATVEDFDLLIASLAKYFGGGIEQYENMTLEKLMSLFHRAKILTEAENNHE